MQNNLGKLQIFSILSDKVADKRRIDAEYYQPFFEHIASEVTKSKHKLLKLQDITFLISNGKTPSKELYEMKIIIKWVLCLLSKQVQHPAVLLI